MQASISRSAKESGSDPRLRQIHSESIEVAKELFGMLPFVLRKEISDIPWEWTPESPEHGTCTRLGLLLQEELKLKLGEENAGTFIIDVVVYTTLTKLYTHAINMLSDGTVVDLSMGQFNTVEKVDIMHEQVPTGTPFEVQRKLIGIEPSPKRYDYQATYGFRNADGRNVKRVTAELPGKNSFEDLLFIMKGLRRDGVKPAPRDFDRAFPGMEAYVCGLFRVDGMDKLSKRIGPCDWNRDKYMFTYTRKE